MFSLHFFCHNDWSCEFRITKPHLLENKTYGTWLRVSFDRSKHLQIDDPWLTDGSQIMPANLGNLNRDGNAEVMVVDND